MMATVHPSASSLLPLLESLEDPAAGQADQTDAYLTIANRLSGEEGKHFLPAVVKHFSRLGKVFQVHIASPNVALSQAALQALGFCVYHSNVVSGIPASTVEEILVALNTLVVKSTDKNTCTRALWVIAKQNFPSDLVAKKVPDVLRTLEAVRAREDLQSVSMEHEALDVVIRLLEQTPSQMGEGAVQWAKLVIPLVVHSAPKVRPRAAAALEMGMPLLLEKQLEVAAIIEPLMSSKLIPELQKLFSSKNESHVLKLWPLFVRLLGKLLHRGGPFINSLLHLEELGFRSSSPIIKKIAFIAWKSLIDNFALNPEILCNAKRLKLLMQPLSSIQVRTEALLLTKLEVWWYLVVKLGPNLAANFDQVGIPLLQSAVSTESPHQSLGTPSRNSSQNTSLVPTTPKTGGHAFNSSASTPRMGLNSSVSATTTQPAFASIQLLGLEMLLHYLLGSDVTATAAKSKLQLSLEPLAHPLLTSPSSFSKHAAVLISAVRDGFITIGKDAPDALLTLIWQSLIGFVSAAIDTAGSKKDRPGSDVLTLLLQALQSIVTSEALPAQRSLGLLEATVKGIPRKILGSAAYQVANMDILNGTPALFLILLFHQDGVLPSFVADERFFLCLETLVDCGLSGPTSALAFSESVLGVMGRNADAFHNKEHLWRMWSTVVNPLTDTITQTNEVNQGDALEHNFTAVLCALMFPVNHLLSGHALPQATQKSLLCTWSKLYKTFARCSALVATAEENVCCEDLCAKMTAALDAQALSSPSTLEAVASILLVIIECVDFSPYTPQFQKTKSPHTPLIWARKKNKALGNLTIFQDLLVRTLESFLTRDAPETLAEGSGIALVLVTVLSMLFSGLSLGTAVQGALSSLSAPLATLYEWAGRHQNEQPKFFASLAPKLEKLLGDILCCLQTRASLAYDDQLLALLAPLLRSLFPHGSKQVRTLVTQFWNATFGNAPVLNYPEELKPVLSRAKQTMPIILPGFQAVDVLDDYSGQYSVKSSQMETHISGVKIASVGKRGSLLSRAGELKEKSCGALSKPVSVKLDFGSPKPPRRELLEEEASVDFVFIPPEAKERVLTEHQKEVMRTKRVDIPAMYNNLDASLDTMVFTQYTQSQEDSVDKLPAEEETAETSKDEGQAEVQEDKIETVDAPEVENMPVQEDMDVSSGADATGGGTSEQERPKEVAPKSADLPAVPGDDDAAKEAAESSGVIDDDCNVSASSDMVSGTPQKPHSRRQSFITLEKYEEGKPASPIGVMKFTGPLTRASGSQDAAPSQQRGSSSRGSSGAEAGTDTVREPGPPRSGAKTQEASQLGEEEGAGDSKKEQPLPTAEKMGKRRREDTEDEDNDVIPDTQVECAGTGQQQQEAKEAKGAMEDSATTGEDSLVKPKDDGLEDDTLDDSNCSQVSPSQAEIRRSGRRRSRPVRPGEDKVEVEERHQQRPKNSLGEDVREDDTPTRIEASPASQTDGQSQGRPGRRSKVLSEAQEVEGKDRSRRSQTDSQTAVQSDSQSQGRVTRRNKAASPGEEDLSQSKSQTTTPASQNDSQSQGRPSRRSKAADSTEEMSQTDKQTNRRSKATSPTDEEMSQTDAQVLSSTHASQTGSQSQGRPGRRSKSAGLMGEEINRPDSQSGLPTSVSQNDSQSQGRPSRRSKAAGSTEEMSQTDSQTSLSTPVSLTDSQSQGRPGRRSKVAGSKEEMSQTDSQINVSTPVSQTDSQSQGRPGRRSKVAGPIEEMSQTDSQTSLSTPVSQTDSQSRGRPGRRSKVAGPIEEMSQTDSQTSLSTPVNQTNSQSRGRPGRRSKMAAELNVSNSSCSTPVTQTEHLESADAGEGTHEPSQGLGRYKTRGSSQNLLTGVENSESDGSETREDGQKPRKIRRKGKLLNSEVMPSSPPKTTKVPECPTQTEATETSPEVKMEESEPCLNSQPKHLPVAHTEAETKPKPSQEKETHDLMEITVPASPVEPAVEAKTELVPGASEAVENIMPSVQCPSSKELGDFTVNSQQVHLCPHRPKRGRGAGVPEAAPAAGGV
ncbi:hypothetical protein AAFF_G00287980 [Aldrovandia affinis]|uniref:Telomere-associated protein Rif1 N-terminal domain-containing protein n=1 Tax=Aldrovandia affinis TaxID=143900 RepID=A0AAD7SS12_9TELE|nr:hypothetical protein AAFF_G00287980 [Aldrovandia affinis]